MNTPLELKTKLLFYLRRKSSLGFTLLELMVVMIFLSIFSAIALPNLVKQAGKAREVEFKNTIGSINRAQQTYHWEKNEFAQGADDSATLNLLNISFNHKYIEDYNIRAYNDSNYATIRPNNPNYQLDQTRAYAGGTYFDEGNYSVIICQSYEVTEIIDEPVNDQECEPNAERIR
ncbi:MAG: prepilin-type N-terminal cleavage/methylation domain-containing protein [Gloeocapsa sp. DLM2.Bin57]|nr:MAG: prepilin-type N-terminal cleavage/methylation domain-containing protein [Gloeocapsa sp. DLM2.Bin57]